MSGQFDRSKINFAQAEGAEPLPTQLALRTMSQEVRSFVWLVVHSSMSESKHQSPRTYNTELRGGWLAMMRSWHIIGTSGFVDEFEPSFKKQTAIAKAIVQSGNYTLFYKFLEFLCRQQQCPPDLVADINQALELSRAPYRIIDQNVLPVVTPEEGEAVAQAFEAIKQGNHAGARAHLADAGRLLIAGEWADSIRESVNAVESVARSIDPSGNTLGDALKALEKKGHIHTALSGGFLKLYGYTNAEQGIRHPLINEQEAKVSETEALYMFGACASFVTYLIRKSADIS